MKVHLTTLGCPKNQVDSELMLGMLTQAGFPLAERAEDAECLVVNTCAFIDRAREESIDTILELAKLKKEGSCRTLIVTGCLTQRYGGDILKEMPEVDGILGTSNLSRIVDLVRQAAGRQDWASSAPPGYLYDATTPRLLISRVPYAYVKIAEGCDMGCTFCAIPQFRGRHRSRRAGSRRRSWSPRTRSRTAATLLATATSPTCCWRSARHACRGSAPCTCTRRTSTTG
jgi:ribosomal protein S12 methylthiotransferase